MSRKYDVGHIGGEVFTSFAEPSDRSALWGELLKEKERVFLRKELQTETVCFTVESTFQISVSCLWQPEAKQASGHRHGRFAMLLHSLQSPLTDAWVWIKLGRPLYKKGFSVIMVDLPGFGRSKMNMNASVKPEEWWSQDWHLICQIVDELRLPATHFVAIGAMCSTVLKIMMRSPHTFEKEMLWYQPDIDPDDVFAELVGPPPPGVGPDWLDKVHEKHIELLERTLRNSKARIWSIHDKDLASPDVKDSQELLAAAAKHPMLEPRIQISEVSKRDICTAHLCKNLPMSFLYISRALVSCIADFFDNREGPFDSLPSMPKYTPIPEPRPIEWSNTVGDPSTWGFSSGTTSRRTTKLSQLSASTKDEGRFHSMARTMTSLTKLSSSSSEPMLEKLPATFARATTAAASSSTNDYVDVARRRLGPLAFEHVRWTTNSQNREFVREVISREQASISQAMKDAKVLTGNAAEAEKSRISLVSRLRQDQIRFVWGNQSQKSPAEDVILPELKDAEPQFEEIKAPPPPLSTTTVVVNPRKVLASITGAGQGERSNTALQSIRSQSSRSSLVVSRSASIGDSEPLPGRGSIVNPLALTASSRNSTFTGRKPSRSTVTVQSVPSLTLALVDEAPEEEDD